MIFRRRRSEAAPSDPSVPPFAPDAMAPVDVTERVGDPIAALAAEGVALPPTRTVEVYPGCTVVVADVEPGYPALDRWTVVRQCHHRLGWWPVLIGEQTWQSTPLDHGGEAGLPAAGDGAQWFTARPLEFGQAQRGRFPHDVSHADADADADDAIAAVAGDLTELTLVPAGAGWQVPGLLGWSGAANYELDGDDHATVLSRWAGRHGVDLVGLSLDTMTLRMARPPETRVQALDLAVEVFAYCPDSVLHGMESLDALAALLLGPGLALWWD